MRKLVFSQFIILLVGTVFAWSNFAVELFDWLNNQPCSTGCSAANVPVNPFFTPCFYGAVFFTLAFLVSVAIMRQEKTLRMNSARPE